MAAEPSRNSLTETGIPTGLNRIKTRRVASSKDKERRSSTTEDSEKLNADSPGSLRPYVKQKFGALVKGRVRINSPREGSSYFAFFFFNLPNLDKEIIN